MSDRGLGTELRTDPVFLGLQKTRLLDPILSLPGTNDHPGDYRASGCTACHVIYANDRSPVHSGAYAAFGNQGHSAQIDPDHSQKRIRPSYPPRVHARRFPPASASCATFIPAPTWSRRISGYTWWDNETDGDQMYPKKQHNPSDDERYQFLAGESRSRRGAWASGRTRHSCKRSDRRNSTPKLKNTQFADFHGHGWIFRAVYKRDRKGNLLDAEDHQVHDTDPKTVRKGRASCSDIHLEKGMHCADCHFQQDAHGNGQLYGETRAAIEIDCIDCHGPSRNALLCAPPRQPRPAGGTDLSILRTPFGQRRFYRQGGKLYQRSMVEKDRAPWEVVQVLDTITLGNPHYNEASRLAKTLLKDGSTWGAPADDSKLAHANSRMTCYTCHSSWTTSCLAAICP